MKRLALILALLGLLAAAAAHANVASCSLRPTEQDCKMCCDDDHDACEAVSGFFNNCGSYWDICYQGCHEVQCAPSDAGCYPSSAFAKAPASAVFAAPRAVERK